MRVMETLLKTPIPNAYDFLKHLNDHGFTLEDLVIGLKAKERELKIEGRFFALMSWKIRLYFVMTEYLIKIHFLPLFSGITMADDLTTVTKKLINSTKGQGLSNYETIYLCNSLDYDKWNSRQRSESTDPTFKAMGDYGLPKLFTLSHQIFKDSFIYTMIDRTLCKYKKIK